MNITWNEKSRCFHLRAGGMSYVVGVTEDGRLIHLYWGGALNCEDSVSQLAGVILPRCAAGNQSVVTRLAGAYELPTMEPGDYTDPLLAAVHPDGVRSLRLRFQGHRVEGDHLTVFLRDSVYPFEVEAHYRGWGDLPLLSRWLVVTNRADAPVEMDALKSAAWHVPEGIDWRLTHLSGNWGAEYTRNRLMLTQARTVLQNNRVTCAAAQQTPFFALDPEGKTTEQAGELFFGVLHWSGDFNLTVERQYGKKVSVTGGLNDLTGQYRLEPGERFETPMFTAGFTAGGFERMTEIFYDWQFDHLMPRGGKTDKAHAVRPVIYNSWYPYEFGVNEDNCLAMADKCADLGAELFVIDDGWMPGRVNDRAGLGDWTADPARFPHGLQAIADRCHARGILFGLWVEPEMVNPDSDLYRAHPDWIIGDPTRPHSLQRNQLVLNLARDDVRDWAIGQLDRVIETYRLDYLKWDMNRYVTENGWPDAPVEQRKSLPIRYTRNLLAIWKHMNEKYPDLLLENCASGGGRSDFGMVPLADRINRSDNADPVDIMVIHEGFSMLFVPKTAGGAGNIAPARHHIHNRPTPLDFRIRWGMTGSMSVGINLLEASEEEMAALRQGIAEFKRLRGDLQDAYVYRIASATEHPYALFEYARRDRRAFTLFAFAHGMRNWDLPLPRFRMRGLIPDALYRCEDGRVMTGEALMQFGLSLSLKGDCDSAMSVWRAE
ncbi:MAG: alpha-galactosidase [Clostridia bacterium]|nr:alpha-galactosidase [Clostridia bacterium]